MMTRLIRHLCFPRWRVPRYFPRRSLRAIEAAIRASEASHGGELRVVVEGGLDLPLLLRSANARQRAAQLFRRLHLQDTRDASGVLIYLQLADRQVEILADHGIDAKVGAAVWEAICRDMETAFRSGDFEAGALRGIAAINRVLAEHCARRPDDANELPDSPVVL